MEVNIISNGRTSRDKRVVSHFNWRTDVPDTTNKGGIADIRVVLVDSVIVNEDHTTTNVNILT